MTKIRINESMLELLLADLTSNSDLVATAVAADALEVSVLRSYNTEARRLVTWSRIRAWEDLQRTEGIDVTVDIE
jgi:hypothetical protein